MTKTHSTQSTPHPPKLPLFLSPDELRACYDIDRNGIDLAKRDSLLILEFLATALATEVINFIRTYPQSNPAGLMLNVDILLPVFEKVEDSELFLAEDEAEDDDDV